jgi:hypothetical protein
LVLLAVATSAQAQDLIVRRADGSERVLSNAELRPLPRQSFEASDHGVVGRFSGVSLRSVLQLAGVGPLDSLRGPLLRRVVLLVGADGYAAAIALADLDPSIGAKQALVVDSANGRPLPAAQGPWRVMIVGDGRPSRWVRQLTRIEMSDVR